MLRRTSSTKVVLVVVEVELEVLLLLDVELLEPRKNPEGADPIRKVDRSDVDQGVGRDGFCS